MRVVFEKDNQEITMLKVYTETTVSSQEQEATQKQTGRNLVQFDSYLRSDRRKNRRIRVQDSCNFKSNTEAATRKELQLTLSPTISVKRITFERKHQSANFSPNNSNLKVYN